MTKQQAIKLIEKNTGMKVTSWEYCRATQNFDITTSTAHAKCGYMFKDLGFRNVACWCAFSQSHAVELITLNCCRYMDTMQPS